MALAAMGDTGSPAKSVLGGCDGVGMCGIRERVLFCSAPQAHAGPVVLWRYAAALSHACKQCWLPEWLFWRLLRLA